jgi:hypothetical protein
MLTNKLHMHPETRHLFRRLGVLGLDHTRWHPVAHRLDQGVGVADHQAEVEVEHLTGVAERSPRWVPCQISITHLSHAPRSESNNAPQQKVSQHRR